MLSRLDYIKRANVGVVEEKAGTLGTYTRFSTFTAPEISVVRVVSSLRNIQVPVRQCQYGRIEVCRSHQPG